MRVKPRDTVAGQSAQLLLHRASDRSNDASALAHKSRAAARQGQRASAAHPLLRSPGCPRSHVAAATPASAAVAVFAVVKSKTRPPQLVVVKQVCPQAHCARRGRGPRGVNAADAILQPMPANEGMGCGTQKPRTSGPRFAST
jgi:hypothetical protein